MEDYYKSAVEEYKKINSDIGNRIIALSLTVVGAIFVIAEKYGVGKLFISSLLGLVLTIATNLANNICNSKHYELLLDEKIDRCDYRSSKWGICAEVFYWIFIFLFVISITFFIIALCILIVRKDLNMTTQSA